MSKKILVVDDEQDIVSMLKMRLEASGYEILTASDGNAAYNTAKAENPDLIILDLMLPGMDGYQVCRLLKFDQKYKQIPIIMLTAKGQQEDKDWGAKAGADFYMTKPFEAKELLNKIKEFIKE
ncbi:MAG: response regulator [Candidatus Omnitrophota bacterium]|nr:response regulator [Candidatus Omnitrophota bacterium]MBU1928281.1 response regulator [Candidatus Omnitrophota bacterium]MBU2035563.1 response regulator [Candidatus Omnitrophota bacterium]MBU2221796.1 response regulator [Candidatus Omnitrophota bacterium]MBU2257964.1 response regulator [Candidatus Omnitrophota bacterium]